jgi:hypothetical protein
MQKDRFDDARSVHSEKELAQKTRNDNYYHLKEIKAKGFKIVVKLLYVCTAVFVLILLGFVLYLFNCPLIKPDAGMRLEQIIHAVFAWGIGVISQYSFSRWKDTAK